MGKISFSTRLLLGLLALIAVLAVALFSLTPQDRWSELWKLHERHWYAEAPGSAAADGSVEAPVYPRYPFRGPYGSFGHGPFGHGPFGHRPPFVPLLLIVVVFFAIGRYIFSRRRTDGSLSILEEQFAEGKIDAAEFERKRSVLNGERGKEV